MNSVTVASRTANTALAAVLGFAILSSACDGSASTPTSATPAAQTPTQTYTLFGSVSEVTAAGSVPVEGARVEERRFGQAVMTDASGRYSIAGLNAMSRAVSITKEGYATSTTTVTLSGDTQLDIRLERIATYTLSGLVFEITEAGQVPIEGVEVYCDSCGSPVGHTSVYTDASGFYSLEWAINGVHPLFVRKAGYGHSAGASVDQYGRVLATVSGNTRFDVQLVKR